MKERAVPAALFCKAIPGLAPQCALSELRKKQIKQFRKKCVTLTFPELLMKEDAHFVLPGKVRIPITSEDSSGQKRGG